MAAPTGRRGRALAACLEAVADGERPLVDLLHGGWEEPAPGAAARARGHDTGWTHHGRYVEEMRARGVF